MSSPALDSREGWSGKYSDTVELEAVIDRAWLNMNLDRSPGPRMRVVFVVAHDRPSAATRVASWHTRQLRHAGHTAEVLVQRTSVRPAFNGHPTGVTLLSDAVAARKSYDVAVAMSWSAWYAMFALPARAYARFALGADEPPPPNLSGLVARTMEEADVALLLAAAWQRTAVGPSGHAAPVVSIGVEPTTFAPWGRTANTKQRVLLAGASAAIEPALRAAHRAGSEIWHLSTDEGAPPDRRADRHLRAVPLEAMPALLRSCDVLVDLSSTAGTGLLPLEMMACAGAVVTAHAPGSDYPVRHDHNALVVPVNDEYAVLEALRRLRDDTALRARLSTGAAVTAAASSWGDLAGKLSGLVACAQPMPAWRRAERTAIAQLLERSSAQPARKMVFDPARWGRALRWGRRRTERLWHRLAPVPTLAHASSRPRTMPAVAHGPGEPVLFVGQPQYFRSAYFDALCQGWGHATPIAISGLAALRDLPARAEQLGAQTCVIFQPELLASMPEVATALRARKVRLIGYSTEPLPQDTAAELHWDQLRRLDHLRPALPLPWDLLLHYDSASVDSLRRLGFAPVELQPLPVSEALFYPEPLTADFDVCFLGWSSPHRERFLHPLKCRYRTVHVAHGLFDEDARRLMNRSRVVVNLHVHDYSNFENRCVQALFCGRPLVSEPLSNDLLTPGRDVLIARSPEELTDHIDGLLSGATRPPVPSFDRTRFLVSSLRALLARTYRTP